MKEQEKRENICRRIAEWLGWKHFKQESALECLMWVGVRPGERVREYVPDYYTNEAANAMILESLPMPLIMRMPDGWNCQAHTDTELIKDSDRKTAIVEAAIKYIEAHP